MPSTFDFCFIISDLLSTTPRALREIKTLLKTGYTVCLVYNRRIEPAVAYHNQLIKELETQSSTFEHYGIEWRQLTPKVVLHKGMTKILKAVHRKIPLRSPFLLKVANDYSILPQIAVSRHIKARVYVGHRPATLPVIHYLAQKHGAHSWFDIEDFHFAESTDAATNRMLAEFIPHFPATAYTDASALIGKAFFEALGRKPQSIEILNSPLVQLPEKLPLPPLKLTFLWFSQTITFRRGLELFLQALKKSGISCRLHLVGNLIPEFGEYIKILGLHHIEIIFHGFIPEDEINQLALESDIGLALELPVVDKSRNMAITNKILTYAVCGNYILATTTSGQKDFMQRLPHNGVLIEPQIETLTNFLQTLPAFLSTIRQKRQQRIQQATPMRWDAQAERLQGFIRQFFG